MSCTVPPKRYIEKLYYSFSISSSDNPVACEITSIATPNFLRLRVLSFFSSIRPSALPSSRSVLILSRRITILSK